MSGSKKGGGGGQTIRNISNQRIKKESPTQRIQQRLLQLIPLEMPIPHALFVNSNPLNSQHAILLAQPPTVKLVIRHNPQKHDATARRQQTRC